MPARMETVIPPFLPILCVQPNLPGTSASDPLSDSTHRFSIAGCWMMRSHKVTCTLLFALLYVKASAAGLPVFGSNMFVVYVREDTAVGEEAYKINATDPDMDKLTYFMSGIDAVYFHVDKYTGVVTVAVSLDRETKEIMKVTISVRDGQLPVNLTQTIIVEDANDVAPIFKNAPYMVHIFENETEGAILFNVVAMDNDVGPAGKVQYEIVEVLPDAPYLFEIQQNGSVILNGTLNYNQISTHYQLKINASDNGGLYNGKHVIQKTSAFAFINIEDVPDMNPIFQKIPYQTTVPENSNKGTPVFQVFAMDGDRGIKDEITYAILSSKPPGLFEIDRLSGEISVKEFLDRENLLDFNAVVELQVIAKEKHLNVNGMNASATTSVSITVTDINDNTPSFYNCSLNACNFTGSSKINSLTTSLFEHDPPGVPVKDLTIVAHDPDKGINGTFMLYLDGQYADAFNVSPKEIRNEGMVQIIVRNSSVIDYEQLKFINIEIVANDTTNHVNCCSRVNVTINILDINDHSPKFTSSVDVLIVKEHASVGTKIGKVTANDPDDGIFGEITYSLLPLNGRYEFKVNSSTGEITVANSTAIDRERRPIYYVTLQATDGGSRTDTTLLEIVLEDINDFPPEMTRDSYSAFITEDKINELNIKIEAFDNDEEGTNNSRVHYAIIGGDYQQNFTIDPVTGVLHSLGAIDREGINPSLNGKITLIVEAYDLGVPSLSTNVNVVINIEDINDNSPIFSEPVYNTSVMEHTSGAFVTLVKATDNDATEINNRVIYRIENGSRGAFLIRTILISQIGPKQYEGNITVDPTTALDYDKGPKFYILGVTATDLGMPSKSAYATVNVTVLDMNDEPPVFYQNSLRDLDVMENNTMVGIVRNITASDVDTNHSLIYEVVSVNCKKRNIADKQPNPPCQYWFGLYNNGSVYVNESSVIDYEEYDEVIITIRVIDLYTEKNNRFTDGTLTIKIVDVNDNPPVFLAFKRKSVIVAELATISAAVTTVQAVDNDTGKNARIHFAVTQVLFIFSDGQPNKVLPNVFEASRATLVDGEYTATIRIKSSLDKTLRGQYNVTIQATDGGDPSLNAISYLDLITVDETFKTQLEFQVTTEEVQRNMNKILVILRKATLSDPRVVGISVVGNERVQSLTRNVARSIMEVYFIRSNGTAIPPDSINSILQLDPESVQQLIELGLLNIKETTEPLDNGSLLLAVIGGLIAAFIIILSILTTILFCIRKSYKRKLKSATAMNTAQTISIDAIQSGPVVPGTNKYTMEGANPVWNTNIDTSTDPGFEDIDSDKTSINSLDENMVDMMIEKPKVKVNTSKTTDIQSNEKTRPLEAALYVYSNNTEKATERSEREIINFTTLSTDI
ncbi:cadherin-related family member 2 [Pristis pectinata]|uniref:cadherin-related family member 2 n=1 Tax=Pristis pectinata TaxID=685728 RepID=UPI00223CC229|nr:cadherin-related family member 2 [Pristis pectinata]